jgi:hypothetical protein
MSKENQARRTEVRSPLESSEEATSVGLLSGLLGGSVIKGFVTAHFWRSTKASRADPEEKPRFKRSGTVRPGVHPPQANSAQDQHPT